MSLFSRYKRPIAEITGLSGKKTAQSMLIRKSAEETCALYVDATAKSGHSGHYTVYFDAPTQSNVSMGFFRGGKLFGRFFIQTVVSDLNAIARKYGLAIHVTLVERA